MRKTAAKALPKSTPNSSSKANNGERVRFQVSVCISSQTMTVSGFRRKSTEKLAISKAIVTSQCTLPGQGSPFWLENEFDDGVFCHLTALVTFSSQVTVDQVEIGGDSDFVPRFMEGFLPKASKIWSLKLGSATKFQLPSSPCSSFSVKFNKKDGQFCDVLPEISCKIADSGLENSGQIEQAQGDSKFEQCPLDILKRILFHIGPEWRFKALLALAGTCKRFRDVFKDAEYFVAVDLQAYCLTPPKEPAYLYFSKRASSLRHLSFRSLKSFPAASIPTLFNASPQLATLILRDCPFVDDAFLDTLLRSQSLKQSITTLDVSGCTALTAKGFVKLGQFRQVKRFAACRLAYTDKSCPFAQVISQMKQLEVLDIADSKSSDLDATCLEIAKTISGTLKALRLGFGTTLTDRGTEAVFAKCKQLEEICISWPHKRPEFSFLTTICPNLRKMSMNSAFDEDFAIWAQFLPNLEFLELREWSTFDVSNVCILLDACSKMTLLSVDNSSGVQPSMDDLFGLRSKYANCVIALHFPSK